jgi:membrane protease YdiL (CAAX protease family)|tara:strand:+ start:241 stop:651 length:411 start_codon:yes stop_codon:yes gene_type:complete
MRRFYLDPAFLIMLLCPAPIWIFLYVQSGFLDSIEIKIFLTLVLVYPIIEEIFFRGLLQPTLANYFSQHWSIFSAANLLTSLVFALMHLINHPPIWALATLIPSLVLGYSMERAKNLSAPITLHCTYNAGYFLFFV